MDGSACKKGIFSRNDWQSSISPIVPSAKTVANKTRRTPSERETGPSEQGVMAVFEAGDWGRFTDGERLGRTGMTGGGRSCSRLPSPSQQGATGKNLGGPVRHCATVELILGARNPVIASVTCNIGSQPNLQLNQKRFSIPPEPFPTAFWRCRSESHDTHNSIPLTPNSGSDPPREHFSPNEAEGLTSFLPKTVPETP
ncbi:hypothetical protein VTK26DRAFT_5429 [Humicola hyalothermophila]